MPSVIRGSDNFDTAGGNAVKAWVNFNGTGTVAIRASFNVSSITDNGVGIYTLNFSTPLSDANYSVSGVHNLPSSNSCSVVTQFDSPNSYSTTALTMTTFNGGGRVDPSIVGVQVFR